MNEYSIDDLKREFDAIPVPEELEFRVKSSIRQAKAQGKGKGCPGFLEFCRRAGGAAVAAVAVVAVLGNISPTIACAMEKVPVLGAITKVVTFRTFEEQGDSTQAHVDVPQVEGAGEGLNNTIRAYTETIIEEYRRDSAQTEAYEQDPQAPEAESNHYALDLRYTVATDNETLFALRFDKVVLMASGVQSVKIYNVDKATGRILTLGDLFQEGSPYLDVLTRNIQNQMEERMKENEEEYYWLHEEVDEMNFTSLAPDADFYVNGQGQLVIVFDEGDVAPMYMGVVEFVIPTAEISQIASPGYFS